MPGGDIKGDTVLVTVIAPGGGRTSTRVPAGVPVGQLAAALGSAVNVANVSELEDETGRRIPARTTLAQAGLGPAPTVRIVSPGLPGGADGTTPDRPTSTAPPAPSGLKPPGATAATPTPAPARPTSTAAPWTPAETPRRTLLPRILTAVALVVVAVVAFVLGGLVWGGSSSTPKLGPGPVAMTAAQAWVKGTPVPAAVAGAVPVGLQRKGAITGVVLQPVSEWHHGKQAGETFAVSSPSAAAYALTVVTVDGRLAFSPTAGPLPPVVGQAPPAPPAQLMAAPGAAPMPVSDWATTVFGPKSATPTVFGLALDTGLKVLGAWIPAGGGEVYRVSVPFSSLAPGAPAANNATAYQALQAKLNSDQAAALAAQAAAAQASAASTAAAAAANNPAAPPTALPAAQAAGAAASAAQAKSIAAQQVVQGDEMALNKTAKPTTDATTAVGTFDVWVRGQTVIGWEPAGYGFTG